LSTYSPYVIVAVIVLFVLAVGAIDYVTGENIHVVALYFVPLALAAWRFGRMGAVLSSLLCTGVWLVDFYATNPNTNPHYAWFVNLVTQEAAFLSVSMLVAVLAEALRKEQLLGRTDTLTGLSNRRAFIDAAKIAVQLCRRHARPVALAYIDLDNFKHVNDSLGHDVGDDYLRKCAAVIHDSLRASDLAARIGGDEFVVFLPETSGDHTILLMERIRTVIESSVHFQAVGVTVSIGVIVDKHAELDIDELLRRADAQMYRVKKSSKNGIEIRQLRDH
jgi:diguanylate cyclase (GGDEF)-like protein